MSYTVTLSTLYARVLQRANLEGATAFVTPAEVYDHINQGICEWYDLVRLTTWGGQFYRAAYPIPALVAGQQSYGMPPNFLSMLSVDVSVGGTVISAQPYPEERRNMFRGYASQGFANGVFRSIFWQLQAGNIKFIPAPDFATGIVINHVPTAPILAISGDTLDTINGWEEFIVLDAAIKCLIKDGQMDIIPFLSKMKDDQKHRIVTAAAARDMGSAECVHDVVGYDDPFGASF